ncbi:hypothetical protein [Pseudomonas turukhanskensis]|uniref:Uncharacterized protein n=1 Tax=Pseudomonas turukhanskensis TaxID=1806536 RepID=A0A9W6K6D3_9PSED|nr:hypothetical protein [Pseudomonas turukhanskensis]GLK88324.1 hypothetical protein GCM10017655_13860 [Pseudomonas turukhanskensis]
MALGDARRASGRANEANRRAIGTTNESERRAIGRQNEADRRGTEVVDEINSLVSPLPTKATLRAVPPVGPTAAKRGTGTYKAPASGTGGGIASPVTEKTKVVDGKTVPDRVYYAAGFTSSDGLFILPAIKTQNMADANGADVVFEFADPAGTV